MRQSDSLAACAALESDMTHISGFERSQLLLLPETVDDYVGADNPRFIDAFVDQLDLAAAGFIRVAPKATGRPGYAPGDLLKLYIYGYLNRVRSSRRLEAECHRNIEVIWLLRSLKPDFKTIADFRSDNRAAFKKIFRQFVILCRRANAYHFPGCFLGSSRPKIDFGLGSHDISERLSMSGELGVCGKQPTMGVRTSPQEVVLRFAERAHARPFAKEGELV